MTLLLEEELLLDSSLDELRMTFEEELLLDPIAALQDDDVAEGIEDDNEDSLDEIRMTFEEELLLDPIAALQDDDVAEGTEDDNEDSFDELRMTFVGKLLESEEHAKNPTLAAVTIIRDVANFLNIL